MSFDFERKVILAPMAGVSDVAMRTLCLEQGADLAFTEMVSSKGLHYANEKTRRLLDLAEGEQRVGVQLFGHEPDTMAEQAHWVEQEMGEKLAYLDINMGCPARKIVSKGDGCALMRDPELAEQIVRSVTRATETFVTCKFRRGWGEDIELAPEFAARMEQAGAAAVAIHGRYAEQMYQGKANWDVIARVKERVSIPVIGNGDIACAQDALDMIDQTRCDSVMVARAAEGNPWIFAQIKAALSGKPIPPDPTIAERIEMARCHARLLSQREGRTIVRMRKHACWYLAGMPGAAKARDRINHCVSLEEFELLFDEMSEYAS